MRGYLRLLLILGLVGLGVSGYSQEEKRFDIYTDKTSSSNHYAPSGI